MTTTSVFFKICSAAFAIDFLPPAGLHREDAGLKPGATRQAKDLAKVTDHSLGYGFHFHWPPQQLRQGRHALVAQAARNDPTKIV